MNCQEARKWISPYLDSELDPTKTFEVSQHLESCEPCRDRFEKEGRADELMAATLRREEPFVNWAALERAISTPRRRIALLRPKWVLAAAACIAFLLISLGEWPDRTIAGDPTQWAIDELHNMSPHCEAFSGGPACSSSDIASVASAVLDCKLTLAVYEGRLGGHPVELAAVRERSCDGGKSLLQIQLNCCGKPVLLMVARMEEKGAISAVVQAVKTNKGRFEDFRESYDHTFYVCAVQNGDYLVIAVAPHKVDHLVSQVAIASN